MSRLKLIIPLLLFGPHTLMAQALVWNGSQWPQTSLSQQFLIDGITVSLDFSGSISRMLDDSPYGLPKDNIAYQNWGIQALWYGVTQLPGSESINLTITFSSPVTDLSFNYYDVDGTNTWEQISVKGALLGGSVYPEISAPAQYMDINQAAGTVRSKGNFDGNPGLTGNTAGFSFGDQAVSSVLITYTTNRTTTGVLLGNLTFVPEPATLVLLGLGVLLCRKYRKA